MTRRTYVGDACVKGADLRGRVLVCARLKGSELWQRSARLWLVLPGPFASLSQAAAACRSLRFPVDCMYLSYAPVRLRLRKIAAQIQRNTRKSAPAECPASPAPILPRRLRHLPPSSPSPSSSSPSITASPPAHLPACRSQSSLAVRAPRNNTPDAPRPHYRPSSRPRSPPFCMPSRLCCPQ